MGSEGAGAGRNNISRHEALQPSTSFSLALCLEGGRPVHAENSMSSLVAIHEESKKMHRDLLWPQQGS